MANREEKLKQITEQLEQGVAEIFTSEKYTEYLNTMAKFHNYSFNNTLLIAMQKPEATLVAGYQAWQRKFNRQVKKGEKGIQIIAPAPFKEKEEIEKVDPETGEIIIGEDGQPETEVVEHVIPRFRVTTVFDVSQTTGEPIPELEVPELEGDVLIYDDFMEALQKVAPVPIQFMEIEGEAKGYYQLTDKYIAIQTGMSEAQTMKTAVHEAAHAVLHDRDQMKTEGIVKDQLTREIEAESIAYVVCNHFDLDTSEYSFSYIANWISGKSMKELRAAMDTIRKTAESFIEDMTEQLQTLQMEHPLEKIYHEEEAVLPFDEYQGVELFDVPVLFANSRIDPASLPEGIYRYELRGADYDPGYPLTVEESVTVNHAATILTVVPLNIPERGYLRIGEELNMAGGMQRIHEYQSEMSERDLTVEREKAENAIGRANEALYLSGTDNRYAIYQIVGNTKGRKYEFMGMDFLTSKGMAVDGADYAYIYGGLLSENDTLDSLYQTFNINHPENYTGHSLSVSDVVVIQKDGETKAYYVDSFGFAELPDFVQQRIHEVEMDWKREDSPITLDTTGVEIEQHEGLWHTVDKVEIENEIFYLMRHNEYGDSVAAVILNADGELVAQDLENGFDQDAMEAIGAFLAEKGIDWHPKQETVTDAQTNFPPLYLHNLAYATEHGEADAYLDSRKLTLECKGAIEETIRQNFDGIHLNQDAAAVVVEKYGEERVAFVLANTVKQLSYDGRFSTMNKRWANDIEIPENTSRGMDLNKDYVVSSHPAVLDGFINLARKEIRTRKLEQIFKVKGNPITKDTKGYEADGHTGTWYSIEAKEYHGESFFRMRNEQYGLEVADIIVSENGALVAEDIWRGFDEDAMEAISEYLEENGATVYDLREFPQNTTVTLQNGSVLVTEETQAVQDDTWLEGMVGKNESGDEELFNFHAVRMVELPDGIKLKMPEIHYIDQYYVIEDLNVKGALNIKRYGSLEEALGAYYSLPNHKRKALGIENTAPLKGSLDFIQCQNGVDTLICDCKKSEGWLNPEIYPVFTAIQDSLEAHDTQIAYQIGEQYFTIQTVEDGYDYTFYDKDYQEKDGGAYDDPSISISEAVKEILQEEGLSQSDARVVDYEELELKTEHAENERCIRTQLEWNCPKSIFDGYDRETALKTYEGITLQLTKGKAYLTVQPTKEGYAYIFYDAKLHETGSGIHDFLDDSIQEAAYAILKKEGMQKEKCEKVDDAKFRENLIGRSKELLEKGIPRRTSELGRCEAALNGMSRAETEYDVLAHTRAVLEEMGIENEVTLIGARVYGSRSREGLYRENSDLDVVVSYRGDIKEDVLFNAVNEAGLKIAGIPVDINPISEEKTGTLAEYMKRAEEYLDDKEKRGREPDIKKGVAEIAAEENDELKTGSVKVNRGSEKTEDFISFYVAECMEFPVLGEYHENLTLEEALAVYQKIPADRMNGIKGIGFVLHDGSDYDGPYDLMRMGKIDRESIEMVQHYKESPLVQKAMNDVEMYFAKKQDIAKKAEQSIEEKTSQKEPPVQLKSRKESVLQALRERQAKIREQEQNASKEKSKAHKKGDVTL